MAYRSWLKDVRRHDDLAKWLHHFPRHHDDWDREIMVEDRLLDALRNPYRPASLKPSSFPYFEGACHDGYIFGIERQEDRLEISIQNSVLEIFCNDFFAEVEEDRDTILSPVRFIFEGVNYVNAVRSDAEGWLKWDDWNRWRPVDDLCLTDQFIRGWFTEQNGKIQWIGHFHKWVTRTRKDPWNLFLLVDCEQVCAQPESERSLRKKIGDDCFEAWQYVQSLPPEEVWLTMGHLRRYLDEKGIPRRHIPHQSDR